MSIIQAVQLYLSNHGIKQSFIAQKCGWTKQKTSAIVRGKKKITADELANICDAIEVPYDYFYNCIENYNLANEK